MLTVMPPADKAMNHRRSKVDPITLHALRSFLAIQDLSMKLLLSDGEDVRAEIHGNPRAVFRLFIATLLERKEPLKHAKHDS